ncbi:hypothetical protein PSH79_18195 [Pseudomonas sp. FP2196]|uniref:hypothetical protein n=1 Tax=Pseudomonas sp. FP2196 TaxID=2954086 RepID=UPI0027357C3E|nr:hypothetical protein [Pseudomonas sp. FP2196]WLH33861.1 hypothetical protein PSH79_18195 [Pseudomonas sp. FP2196]
MTSETPTASSDTVERSFADFLEASPPNQIAIINDLMEKKWDGGNQYYFLKTPEIQIHCPDESCNGIRFHRCVDGHKLAPTEAKPANYFIVYRCSNCTRHVKSFAISAYRDSLVSGTLVKFGENPVFGPPVASRLLKLIGPDRENFLKGRRCENQGLGIGAFVYYRRVVEHQKNRIFKEIVKVSEKIGAPTNKINILNAALEETQFTKALDMAKDAMPDSLLINGHSPLKLLYRALSEGIHNLSDEECLGFASSVRIVLGELSDRLSQALKDEAEITNALNRLLAPTK